MTKKKKNPYTKKILIIAFVFAIIIYAIGVLSGIFANNVFEEKFSGDIGQIRKMIDDSSIDIKSLQLQDFYITHFEEEEACSLLDIYINDMYNRISVYWKILPQRLEEYETHHEITEEYNSLKREYIRLSLRTWLITRNNYYNCNNKEIMPVLYFYSSNCSDCIAQGEIFDDFKNIMLEKNKTVMIFPVDFGFEDDTAYMLKRHYNITSAPATVIHGMVFKEVVNIDKLQELFENNIIYVNSQ